MRTCSLLNKLQINVVLGLFLSGLAAHAQMPGAGGPAGMTAAMAKLFGDIKGFSAKAETQVLDSSQKEMVKMPMDFAFLDGKMRVQIDMAQMKSSSMPPGAIDQLKKMGMTQVTSVVRPDKKLAYVIYPESKVLMSLPLPKEEEAKVTKTALGKETIDGHPCAKTKVVISDGKGQDVEATTWNASDLKDFPIQIRTQEKENTSIIRFSNVQLTKPDAKDFEPPSGYTQYNSPQELMQGMMSKMQEQGEKK
ncbi:MAG TPA: hypothetical protein VJA21_28310 [Verrucomicrobiae bacterium]